MTKDTPRLGVHHLTAMELDPLAFIETAAQVGAQEVSLFGNQMGPQAFPLVTVENCGAVKRKLCDTGIQMANLDPFPLSADVDFEQLRAAIDLAAELGARSLTALLFDTDEARTVDTLSWFCECAGERSLKIGIEFMALSPRWNTLEEAVALVDRVGRANLGVGIDVLHLIRSGGGPRQVAATDPRKIAYAQLCDSLDLSVTSDYGAEAATRRLAPGDGSFPLGEFIRALPEDISLELEVPQPAERPALDRLRYAVDRAREIVVQARKP